MEHYLAFARLLYTRLIILVPLVPPVPQYLQLQSMSVPAVTITRKKRKTIIIAKSFEDTTEIRIRKQLSHAAATARPFGLGNYIAMRQPRSRWY